MSRGMSRSERLDELKRLYVQRAFSDFELAERLQVDRTTIYKDRCILETEYPFVQHENGRYKIDRKRYISEIKLNLHEALALYLAARRFSRQTHIAQPHVATAVEKLAVALRQPMTERLVRAADVVLTQTAQPERIKVLEAIAEGWVCGQKIRITHQGLRARQAQTHIVSPYLIEPSLLGEGTYLIGYSDVFGDVATFKVERIEHAVVTSEEFALPEDFDEQRLLQHAWGIWYGEGDLETVKLRFAPGQATRRLKESIWHPSQAIADSEDGGCIWTAQVAEWREMVPWVRGWGSDVEALEPAELRDVIANEVSLMSKSYLVPVSDASTVAPHRLLWAKADRKTNAVHRLVFHMVDVGLAAQVVWEQALHPKLKQRLANWLNLTPEDTGRLIAFIASLHDLGKASPAFQDHPRMPGGLRDRIVADLRFAGLNFKDNRPVGELRARHEVLSTWALRPVQGENLLSAVGGLPVELAASLAQTLGGHHGAWPRPDRFSPSSLKGSDKGGSEWTAARTELTREMTQIFLPPAVASFEPNVPQDNVMLTLLSAIVAAADWIGSNESYFPFENEPLPLRSYVRHARVHAEYAVATTRWEPSQAMPDFAFDRVFPFQPNDTQHEIAAALKKVPLPALAIIEAPMGVGKTEAAFAAYADWAQRNQTAGLYIAMPTTATSNQMHSRTADFLTKQMGENIEPLLVHSQALLRDLPDLHDPIEELEHEGDAAAGQTWFLPRKKSLLAPYGVGTVDQALMSVLQTKHFFVRLLGLSHKVIIFDEVHAYDAYMSELFERLLTWLRAVDASVIVLSATLPDKTRANLVAAYSSGNTTPPACQYPRLTYAAADGSVDAIPLAPPPSKTLYFDWMPRNELAIIAKLRETLQNGGCAAVICSTVTRAQDLFQAIRDLPEPEKFCDEDNVILFHARFPMAWREEIGQKVLGKFGPGPEKGKPNPDRPCKAIVVATQVIEQSLDLDFDVMISDHAPIDLLLQRSGRLQRHDVNNPRSHPNCLWIAVPPEKDGVPQFDRSDKYVYDEYVLLRSWLALKTRRSCELAIPEDLSALIESVYGEENIVQGDAHLKAILARSRQEMIKKEVEAEAIAEERLVLEPTHKRLLTQRNVKLEDEDDPEVNAAFRALTRLGDPGIHVVCLHRINDRLFLESRGKGTQVDPYALIDKDSILRLAKHVVQVRHPDPSVSIALLSEPIDPMAGVLLRRWKRVPALRFCRVLIFERGQHRLPNTKYLMTLDRFLGLRIQEA